MKRIFLLLFCFLSLSAYAGYTINPNDQTIRGLLWPNGRIPYVIDSSMAGTTANIQAAIADYTSKTVIRWVPRTNEKDYVEFKAWTSPAAGSSVGMQLGKQWIMVHAGEGIGTLIHEMGHTVGLYHEFQNPDQTKWTSFVGNINNANDKFCKESFYDTAIYTADKPATGISKYYRWDSQSQMQYFHGCWLNANAPLRVNANYPGSKRVYPVPGWLLSPGDAITINGLYADKNLPPSPTILTCEDDPQVGSESCKIFKQKGDCENYYMSIAAWSSCKATCGICKPGMLPSGPTPVPTLPPTPAPTVKPTVIPPTPAPTVKPTVIPPTAVPTLPPTPTVKPTVVPPVTPTPCICPCNTPTPVPPTPPSTTFVNLGLKAQAISVDDKDYAWIVTDTARVMKNNNPNGSTFSYYAAGDYAMNIYVPAHLTPISTGGRADGYANMFSGYNNQWQQLCKNTAAKKVQSLTYYKNYLFYITYGTMGNMFWKTMDINTLLSTSFTDAQLGSICGCPVIYDGKYGCPKEGGQESTYVNAPTGELLTKVVSSNNLGVYVVTNKNAVYSLDLATQKLNPVLTPVPVKDMAVTANAKWFVGTDGCIYKDLIKVTCDLNANLIGVTSTGQLYVTDTRMFLYTSSKN